MNRSVRCASLVVVIIGLLAGMCAGQVVYDGPSPAAGPVSYGIEKLEHSLEQSCVQWGKTNIVLRIDSANGQSGESYKLEKDGEKIVITGSDSGGLMYGALGLAEKVRNGVLPADVRPISESAHFAFRAIKFNLPWDSYRSAKSLQLHTETCRDIKFWEAFLDMMAENRFNVLTLWNLHPFNFMVRCKNFPEACSFSDAELAEWQKFWHRLFAMAKKRNIETYIVNWNVIVPESFEKAHNIKPSSKRFTGRNIISETVNQYTRESITEVLKQYPELAGLGVSLGDRMGGMTAKEREQWVLDVFVKGMQEAGRPVKFIHRVPFSADKGSGGSTSVSTEQMTRRAIESIEGITLPVLIEVKFNWSHGHSTAELVQVHGGEISDSYWDPQPDRYKVTWMVRNEDFFCLRWGQPEFIRRHIARNGKQYVTGYYIGSECYIPAVDYFERAGLERPWKYAFERQWFYYKSWGRLLYNPETPDGVFEAEFSRRFGDAGAAVFEAFKLGSLFPLRLTSFCKPTWDFTLYSEGLLATAGDVSFDEASPFISVDELMECEALEPGYISIGRYVESCLKKKTFPQDAVTPLELAEQLELDGRRILELLEPLGEPESGTALFYECTDARAWGWLSLYLAEKIRGGTELKFFRLGGSSDRQKLAVSHLTKALGYWDELIGVTRGVYRDMPLTHLNRVSDDKFHWALFRDQVERDIELAKLKNGVSQ